MGYSTDFNGGLSLTPVPTEIQIDYINEFSDSRRMGRNVDVLMKKFNGKHGLPLIPTNLLPASESSITDLVDNGKGKFVPVDRSADEIYGNEGEFFIGDETTGVIDYNTPPGQLGYSKNFNVRYTENEKRIKEGKCQPGLWCKWIIEDKKLVWNGCEKFYYYVEWLQYMINKFFTPWGITLNGEIEWQGDDNSDLGKIVVENNVITIKKGKKVYG